MLKHDWQFWARREQRQPRGFWVTWLIVAGRGWGKTRCGAEWLHQKAFRNPGCRLAVIGETLHDARMVMVEGESGLLQIAPPWFRPTFESSKRQLIWPNGSVAHLFSAEDPDQLRGPQFHYAWCDEVAKWHYAASWDNMKMALRLGKHPRVVATTTPKPVPLMKTLLAASGTVVTRGSTFDNAVNLPEAFIQALHDSYSNTRLGRQELYAEMLADNTHALWQPGVLEMHRVVRAPPLNRIVVAIDPAVSSNADSSETGIVVAGIDDAQHVYVLRDASGQFAPEQWARTAVTEFHQHRASRVIAEVNNGGALVEQMLRVVDPTIPYRAVRAMQGKLPRAEPVAALYEQGRVHHVGYFPQLEEQLCSYDGTGTVSPDRLDALVWAVTELALGQGSTQYRIRQL